MADQRLCICIPTYKRKWPNILQLVRSEPRLPFYMFVRKSEWEAGYYDEPQFKIDNLHFVQLDNVKELGETREAIMQWARDNNYNFCMQIDDSQFGIMDISKIDDGLEHILIECMRRFRTDKCKDRAFAYDFARHITKDYDHKNHETYFLGMLCQTFIINVDLCKKYDMHFQSVEVGGIEDLPFYFTGMDNGLVCLSDYRFLKAGREPCQQKAHITGGCHTNETSPLRYRQTKVYPKWLDDHIKDKNLFLHMGKFNMHLLNRQYAIKKLVNQEDVSNYKQEFLKAPEVVKNNIDKGIEAYMPELYEKYSKNDYKYLDGQIPVNLTATNEDLTTIYKDIHNMTQKFLAKNIDLTKSIAFKSRIKLDKKPVIFTAWFQGEDKMPELIKLCYESMKRHSNGHKVILITEDNIADYIDIDVNVAKNLKEGNISYAFFSDYVRCCLLAKYDGIWLDSTIGFTKDIDEKFFKQKFACVKTDTVYEKDYKVRIFQRCYEHFPILYAVGGTDNRIYCIAKEVIEQYFKEHEYIVNYLFINDIFEFVLANDSICKEEYEACYKNNEHIDIFSKVGRQFTKKDYDLGLSLDQAMFKFTYKILKLSDDLREFLKK